MRILIRSTSTLALLAVLALSGCSDGTDSSAAESAAPDASAEEIADSEGGKSEEPIAMAESGWLTVGNDGAVQTTFLDADGRYRDYRNNELLAQGTWQERSDGELCFEPDAGIGACWEISTPNKNGATIATDGDGKSIEIKRVTYIAPPEDGADTGG